MNICVICSAGGSAFLEIVKVCPHISFFVITDRSCGVEPKCTVLNIPVVRIEDSDNNSFSQKVVTVLEKQGEFDFIVMFFSRLVTEPLLSKYILFNIHPSLLPAFKGMGALKKAKNNNVRFFGTTIHLANDEMDAGHIIAQTCQPLVTSATLFELEKLSFIQKTVLFLLIIDLWENKAIKIEQNKIILKDNLPYTQNLNPSFINNSYVSFIKDLQQKEGVKFL
ncbi:formyltransferase family protein [Geminocystis sp. GBBB08]|uniref:formyltransferase family protein n=1 Tax=Geminocystis sp. GBBB08 TaxID=2604140 RepID=UPI0027E2F3D1|nr:formyltransferase family protein [Geminocystis sp. GBBB08]MBL1210715.1 hypothetical protein [Geminocystis sp. GBBB08]